VIAMPITTAIRLFIVFALMSVVGFVAAGWTAGGTLPVLIGVVGMFAAAAAFVAEIDRPPGTTGPTGRRRRTPRIDGYARRAPLAGWEASR
jgi:hypothetical protein